MQEGTAAFFRMADIARVAGEHLSAGQVRIGWLRNPTTGGVMATWGSYADITAGEPDALLGFLGPRVYEALYGEAFPEGVQTAENLARVGVIDGVLPLAGLRAWVAGILDVTNGQDLADEIIAPKPAPPTDAWDAVQRTRGERVGPLAVIDLLTQRRDLSGTGAGETGDGVRVSLGRLRGRRVVMVAQTRREVTPADLRVAQRGLLLADRLGLPVATLVDTPGGQLSVAAEESAMAGEIARTLQTLTSLEVPSVSVVMGQGCGGAALALIPAKTRICMENGWVSPLPPEGASVIMHRTADFAADLARQQGVGAHALLEAGVVDQVVAEGDDLAAAVADAVAGAL
jgi:acetyl-CoA carboxylase carboxyl transferase subunit beta